MVITMKQDLCCHKLELSFDGTCLLSVASKTVAMSDWVCDNEMPLYVCVSFSLCVNSYGGKLSGLTHCTQSACDIAQG